MNRAEMIKKIRSKFNESHNCLEFIFLNFEHQMRHYNISKTEIKGIYLLDLVKHYRLEYGEDIDIDKMMQVRGVNI